MQRSAFLGAAAAASLLPAAAFGQDLPKIRLGGTASGDIIGALYGIRSGTFRRNGVDVEYTYMSGGEAILAALLGGSLEIGKVAIFDIIRAHAKGVPVLIEAPSEIYTADAPDAALVVAANSPIHKASDLNGKTLSSPGLNDFFAVATRAWLDANGADSTTMKFVELPGRSTAAAIAAGRIDGASLAEPVLNDAVNGGGCRILGYTMNVFGRRYCATAFVTTAAYAAQHGDVLARFRKALSDAATYANGHRSEMIPILAQTMNVDAAKIAALPTSTPGTVADLRDPSKFQPLIEQAVKYKVIASSFPYTDMIDPAALR